MYKSSLVICIAYLAIINCSYASIKVHHQSDNDKDKQLQNELTSDKLDKIQIPKDQTLLVRLPSNTLLKYTAYKDVSILHFRIPPDTRTSLFTFKAYEESKSAFLRVCQPRDVTLHLKAGSYPVISPENITFPRNFLNADQRFDIYSLQFKSNGMQQRITIDGPQVGNWFAVAFISWTDPNNDRIEQQGLAASCDTLLMAEMSVSRFTPIILNSGQLHNSRLTGPDQNDNDTSSSSSSSGAGVGGGTTQPAASTPAPSTETIYKFYVPQNVGVCTARITIAHICPTCPDIGFYVHANALPTEANYIHSTIIKPNQTGEISFEFYVQSSTWHYVQLRFERESPAAAGGLQIINVPTTPPSVRMAYELEYSLQIDYHEETDPETGSSEPDKPVTFRDIEFYPLLRQTYREFFMFDYDLIPDANGTVPSVLNLTAGKPTGFRFEVGDVYDIGGTLTFAVSMKHDISKSMDLKGAATGDHHTTTTERGGILAEKLIGRPAKMEESPEGGGGGGGEKPLPRSNQTIIVCIRLGEPGEPTWPDKCRYGRKILPASSIVNNTDSNTSTGLIHVPFPESGQWYVTMGLYCHGAETAARVTIIDSVKDFVKEYSPMLDVMRPPCACASTAGYYRTCIDDRKCLAQMNETETLKVKECLMDSKCTDTYIEMTKKFEIHHKFATEQHFATDNCNTSVVFTVSSSPCVAGRCGRYGRCYHYMSGGFVFSTCVCMKGYRGWDCTEDTQVPSSMSILVASLLLILSNLLFIPSIWFALRRKYQTEAVIYFFAMFFSIFYHACDSGEDDYSFCLVKLGVLQFCDFYCGLLAIWVTLVAMANLRPQFVSLLHMFGAILLAFGTELDKQSLWVFLAPALTGICIISCSWGLRCRKTHKWFPAKRYLTVWMPLGAVLVMVGLVCYAFLQTKQNYYIVHSVWHMVMALSILCLLPSRQSFIPKC